VTEPAVLAEEAEQGTPPAAAAEEVFRGYGIMGLPLSSGYVLALRRFPATSIGPGYTSAWIRDPAGAWTFYADVDPLASCSRYFGAALRESVLTPISLDWPAARELVIRIPSIDFEWSVALGPTAASRAMNRVAAIMPAPLWRNGAVLSLMGTVAGTLFRAGRVRLQGQAPNGQRFAANPFVVWPVVRSRARLGSQDLGEPRPVAPQTRLGDFWLPQRGLFVAGMARFEAFDPARHLALPAIVKA
jgi:hypothetical protein